MRLRGVGRRTADEPNSIGTAGCAGVLGVMAAIVIFLGLIGKPNGPDHRRHTVRPSSHSVNSTERRTSQAKMATAICRDSTYSNARHHEGACSYHGGVARWLK